MILTRLYEHAQRLQDKLPIEGYWGEVRLSWLVELNQDGTLKANGFTKLDKNDPRRKLPDRIRAAGIKPKLLADNGEYVFWCGARDFSPQKKLPNAIASSKNWCNSAPTSPQNPSVQAVC